MDICDKCIMIRCLQPQGIGVFFYGNTLSFVITFCIVVVVKVVKRKRNTSTMLFFGQIRCQRSLLMSQYFYTNIYVIQNMLKNSLKKRFQSFLKVAVPQICFKVVFPTPFHIVIYGVHFTNCSTFLCQKTMRGDKPRDFKLNI